MKVRHMKKPKSLYVFEEYAGYIPSSESPKRSTRATPNANSSKQNLRDYRQLNIVERSIWETNKAFIPMLPYGPKARLPISVYPTKLQSALINLARSFALVQLPSVHMHQRGN
jgi:hypothetical protein